MHDPTKRLEIYTIALSQWRKAKEMNIPLLDITYKSGISAFAPSGKILGDYKKGLLTDAEYTKLYIQKMRNSLMDSSEVWESLFLNKTLALACYCKDGIFCHRHILSGLLVKYAKYKNYELVLKGEINGQS